MKLCAYSSRFLFWVGAVALVALPMRVRGERYLVKEGRPQAEIVIGSQPARLTRLAAGEFQGYLFKISGAIDRVVRPDFAVRSRRFFSDQVSICHKRFPRTLQLCDYTSSTVCTQPC